MRGPAPGQPCWIDGRRATGDEASIALTDPAALAGFGLFETLAVREGRPLDLELHLERLASGAARLAVTLPGVGDLAATVGAAAREIAGGWLKIVVSGHGRSFVFGEALEPAAVPGEARAVLLPWRRNPADPLVGLKTLAYAGNLLGLEEARRRGADEGLWRNTRGHLAEGCSSNLFVVCGRRLFTAAPRDGILPGIVRGLVLELAREAGLVVHEGKLRLPRLLGAREAFLTSSVAGVRGLVCLDGRPIGSGRPGPWTRRLAEAVEARRVGSAIGLAPKAAGSGPA